MQDLKSMPPTLENEDESSSAAFSQDKRLMLDHSDSEVNLGDHSEKHEFDEHKKWDASRQQSKKFLGLVILLMAGNALVVIGATYGFLSRQESNNFKSRVSPCGW